MTPETLSTIGWLSLKVLTLIGIVVYGVFAAVMVRQERLMANVLEEGFEPALRAITFIHLAMSIAVFFLAIILL